MKSVLMLATLVLLSLLGTDDVSADPNTPIIGIIGGTHGAPCTPAEHAPFPSGIYGCSMKFLDTALTEGIASKNLPYKVVSFAQAASVSADLSAQYEELVLRTTWFESLHTERLIIALMGDCGLSPCDEDQLEQLVVRTANIAKHAIAEYSMLVYANEYPPYDRLDLEKTARLFGTQVLSRDAYETMARMWKCELAEAGVQMVDGWRSIEPTDDGYHPSDKSSREAARRMLRAMELME